MKITFQERAPAARLERVISRTQEGAAVTRLSDLRRAQPADATLKNLIGVLNTKLELCSHLPVFAWEASNEGCEESAVALRTLAEMERRSCAAVIDCLRDYLELRRSRTRGGAA
jgi:hypothetical protein